MPKFIFCGDLVLPFGTIVDYSEIRDLFSGAVGVTNLEGAILDDERKTKENRWDDKFSLYSSPAVMDIMKDLGIKLVSLCNNHILDYKVPISETERLLRGKGFLYLGLKNPDSIKMTIDGVDYFFITFATSANENNLPVLNPQKAVSLVSEYRKDKTCKIIVFPHWGMERYQYPEMADRKLGHQLIDAGADIIVGHHPHCIQPIEIYKGHYIYYSIGNFIMPQEKYGNKKLFFKQDYILDELVVEWNGEDVVNHVLHYDKDKNILSKEENYNLTQFTDFFNDEKNEHYLKYYFHRTKLIRILFFTRLGNSWASEKYSIIVRKLFRKVRCLAIKLGLHHPF